MRTWLWLACTASTHCNHVSCGAAWAKLSSARQTFKRVPQQVQPCGAGTSEQAMQLRGPCVHSLARPCGRRTGRQSGVLARRLWCSSPQVCAAAPPDAAAAGPGGEGSVALSRLADFLSRVVDDDGDDDEEPDRAATAAQAEEEEEDEEEASGVYVLPPDMADVLNHMVSTVGRCAPPSRRQRPRARRPPTQSPFLLAPRRSHARRSASAPTAAGPCRTARPAAPHAGTPPRTTATW